MANTSRLLLTLLIAILLPACTTVITPPQDSQPAKSELGIEELRKTAVVSNDQNETSGSPATASGYPEADATTLEQHNNAALREQTTYLSETTTSVSTSELMSLLSSAASSSSDTSTDTSSSSATTSISTTATTTAVANATNTSSSQTASYPTTSRTLAERTPPAPPRGMNNIPTQAMRR